MSKHDLNAESYSICETLRTRFLSNDEIIAVFMPLPDEPDIEPFIAECLKRGISICTPAWKSPDLTLKIIRSLGDVVMNPKTKIREPSAEIPSIDPAEITIVLVPGQSFTRSGGRLGRGGGAYDRWINAQRRRNPATVFIGVCFKCQIAEKLPMEKHDEKVDEVVTG